MAVHSLPELGWLVRAYREQAGLSQRQLGAEVGIPRTAVAHLEQGHRLPSKDHLLSLATHLRLPDAVTQPFLQPGASQRIGFEVELGELIGKSVTIAQLDFQAVRAVEAAIKSLLGSSGTNYAAFDTLREIQVFYGIRPVSRPFFERYFTIESFQDLDMLSSAVQAYQAEAIRLFPTFSQAYDAMTGCEDLEEVTRPLEERSLSSYMNRAPWDRIEPIPEERLADLGYVAAQKLDRERKEREALSAWLRELAERLRSHGASAIASYKPKKRRQMETLQRKFDSRLQHGPMSPLFAPSPTELETEAERIAPKDELDRQRIADTQATGLKNLSQYLAADHMDVYIATSMRTDSDFVSVSRFATALFSQSEVKPLKLRHFNPTQSWVEDRIAKGLVEALMLRRASVTIYMAQKVDTFGKDSEASVALGQGKPVIVYVPKLVADELDLDSSSLAQQSEESLTQMLVDLGVEDEPDSLDREALLGAVLTARLSDASPNQLQEIVRAHWADFGLEDEAARFKQENRGVYLEWLRRLMSGTIEVLPDHLRDELIGVLVATSLRFEKRASLFREKHPLALQVILSTGVLNGILVARSVQSCAELLKRTFENSLDLELKRGEDSYRLVERTTQSTIRVISKHQLLGNAFASYYSGE